MPAMPALPTLKVVYGVPSPTGHFLGAPTDNVRVEFAGGFGVAGHEFVPAEFSFWRKHVSVLLVAGRNIMTSIRLVVDINIIEHMSTRVKLKVDRVRHP